MDNEKQLELQLFRKTLGKYKYVLTRQQLLTLKGLAKSGNVTGAYKGLKKILERRTA